MSMRHHLKTWPEYFAAVLDGTKTFEVRKNDRDFRVGDELLLKEWDPDKATPTPTTYDEQAGYTGRRLIRVVTYVLAGGFGVDADYAVLALAAPEGYEGLLSERARRKP